MKKIIGIFTCLLLAQLVYADIASPTDILESLFPVVGTFVVLVTLLLLVYLGYRKRKKRKDIDQNKD